MSYEAREETSLEDVFEWKLRYRDANRGKDAKFA